VKTKNIFFITLIFSIALACSTSKKAKSTASTKLEEPSINLDTVNVFAEEPATKKAYMATETKLSDIIHTKLWVSFDWQKSQLIGKAELAIKPYFYATNMLYLNARGMDIKSVKLQELAPQSQLNFIDKPSSYKYENDSLKINLGKEYTAKETYYITIEYIAKPNDLKKGGSDAINEDKGLYFINPTGSDPDKMPQIWTQGETQSNSVWFPTLDNPNEKMTNEIYMTVDTKYLTLSNGLLKDSKKNTDGTRTDHWVMDMPHAPYLVMMGVGEFVKITDEPWNGKEISYYVEKEYAPHAKAIFGKTKKMIEFYSTKLGTPYPWQKYAQIVARDYVSGAMENTTATLHGDFVCYQVTRDTIDEAKGESTIAHELFHQWFGDYASCESWSNLTLNESFATYGEYLWEEFEHGKDAADFHHAESRYGYISSAERKQADLVRFDYDDREDMFDAISYNKGGQILHMLRKYVGDDAFFASLKLYLENNKFKTAEAHHLRLAFEEVTGEDLNWYFNQWYFAKGHPILNVSSAYNKVSKELVIKIEQTQDFKTTPLFKLPIYVDIYADGKIERKRIWINTKENTYTFNVSTEPNLVNVDAERQVLAIINYPKNREEYIYQYKNAKLWGDRDESISYFAKHTDDKEIYGLIKTIAANDPWFECRRDAINILGNIAKANEADLKPLFLSIYKTDKKSKVRASALKALSSNYAGNDLNAVYESALTEQSYAIVSEGFDGIAQTNPTLAMQKAKALEVEQSKSLMYSIIDLYSKNGTDENNAYFKKIKPFFSGYELIGFANLYGKFLKRCTKPETAIEGAKQLVSFGKSENKYVKFATQKVFKDNLLNVYQAKETALTSKIEKAKKENVSYTELESELKQVSETNTTLIELYNSIKK
jgi:aminopeptidase N